ncbi:hypothetical protein ACFWBB_16320 [Streptomyces sp. NPDC060000]|uniref:hypothetical protein n=1 Tax=Streptomyces sp. NPDC060000 TaxID=3347031 RepID=UPI0036CD056D
METVVVVAVLMAVIAPGVLLIHLANRQHSYRIAAPTTATPERPRADAAPGRNRGESS